MFILRYGQIERENEETEFRREMEELGFAIEKRGKPKAFCVRATCALRAKPPSVIWLRLPYRSTTFVA